MNPIQLTKKLHDHFSKNEFEKVLELADENVQIVAYALGATFKGKEQFLAFMQGFKSAFPDMAIRHTNVFTDGSNVAAEFEANATHTGPLQTPMGTLPPSGNSIKLNVVEIQRWEDGLLKSIANYQDAGSLMRQIGAM